MAKKNPQEDIARMTAMLREALGGHLDSLVLYGSVLQGMAPGKYTDTNLVCVLDEITTASLDAAALALAWWTKQGYPPVVLLSRDEQRDSSDVFPLEYLDIQHQHRVLAGKDAFAEVAKHPQLHRLQVEHDLRTHLIRLRNGYALAQGDAGKLEKLMAESLLTFLVLFRHALLALGEPLVLRMDDIIEAASRRFQFEPQIWRQIHHARHDSLRLPKAETRSIFAAYLGDIQKVEREMERQ